MQIIGYVFMYIFFKLLKLASIILPPVFLPSLMWSWISVGVCVVYYIVLLTYLFRCVCRIQCVINWRKKIIYLLIFFVLQKFDQFMEKNVLLGMKKKWLQGLQFCWLEKFTVCQSGFSSFILFLLICLNQLKRSV